MSIAAKNAMPIRPKMDVYAALVDYNVEDMDLTITMKNPAGSTTFATFTWPTASPSAYAFGYDVTPAGGLYQSWQSFNIQIDEDEGDEIPRLFVLCDAVGEWTVKKDNGPAQPVRSMMLFNTGDNTATLKFTHTGTGSNDHVRIWAVVPCSASSLALGNESLTNVTLDLAGSLDLFSPTYEVSTIEVEAYVPGINLGTLVNLPDRVPIVYMSGYDGDEMSFPRFFYLSEVPEYEKSLLKLTGEDSSASLDSYQVPSQVVLSGTGNGLNVYYNTAKGILESAGIGLAEAETAPPVFSTGQGVHAIIKEQTGREFIADMMAVCRYSIDQTGNVLHDFMPTFVDAGRPVLRWKYYDADSPAYGPFDIYESDIGDLKEKIDQAVKTIKTDDAFGLSSTIWDHSSSTVTIATVAVNADRNYKQSWQNYYRGVAVSRSTTPKVITATSASWRAASTGNSVITGYLQDVDGSLPSIDNDQATRGREVVLSPKIYGRFSQLIDNGEMTTRLGTVPFYYWLFKQSPEHGSFTWKGNPLMQPRDPFWFHHADGTYEAYTIERIELTHEEGGTSAVIHYRKGVC